MPVWPGASHQTGWTGLMATLIELLGRLQADKYLQIGKSQAVAKKAGAR